MKRILGVVVLAFLVLFLAGAAVAEEFSADVSGHMGNSGAFQGKVFMSNQKMRMETPQSITISRMDRGVVWMLMPQQKMYMEMGLGSEIAVSSLEKLPGEIERQSLGTEMVNGKLATKYRIVTEQQGIRGAILHWIAPGLNFPVKIATENGSVLMEYTNFRMGPQDQSLFELPSGYQKMSDNFSPAGGMDTEASEQNEY